MAFRTIACFIGGKIAEHSVEPIGRQFGYVIFYKSNLDKLREEVNKLEERSGAWQLSVDAARRNGKIIGPDVQGWLERAKEYSSKASEILKKEIEGKKGCLNGWCPNLKARHSLGRKAAKMAKEVAELNQEGNFPRVSYNKKRFLRRAMHAVKAFLRGAWKIIQCKQHATVHR